MFFLNIAGYRTLEQLTAKARTGIAWNLDVVKGLRPSNSNWVKRGQVPTPCISNKQESL